MYIVSTDETVSIFPAIFLGLICPFLATLGTFLHTIKQNDYGLLLIFPAFAVALFLELVSGRLVEFVGRLIYLGVLPHDFYFDLPYILVLITTIFALNSLRLKYRFF